MARMIPSQFSTSKARGLDEKSGDRAELLVFAALQELPNSYTCLHSYRMARREIDFLIIHPETPLVFLEVKGGLLVQKDGRSYQENRATKQLYEISPIEQLYAAREDLIFGLRAGALEEAAKAFPFVFFAVFPDSLEPTSLLPQFDGASLFGDQLNLPEKLNEIFMTKARKFGALGHANAQALIEFFSREIRAQPHVLLEKLFDQEEKITKGTQESVQAHIETILANPQFLVQGPAGTGKTILLTELARTLAQKGERVLITCYNDLIEHLLQSTFKESPKVQVSNFHHLCEDSIEKAFGRQLLQQQKQLLQTPADTKNYFSKWLPDRFVEAIDSLKAKGDLIPFATVLVDEGQDFKPEWLMALRELLDTKASRIGLFTDPIQNIQNEEDNSGAAFDGRPTRILLRYNIRNTKQICSYAATYYSKAAFWTQMLLKPIIPPGEIPCCGFKAPPLSDFEKKAAQEMFSCSLEELVRRGRIPDFKPLISPEDFPNGKVPELFQVSDEMAASEKLSSLFHDLVITEKIPLSRITVLSSLSHRDILRDGKAGLRQGRALGPYKLGAESEAATKTVQLETIRRFKGRENLVIIAVEYGEIEDKLRYVTYSRALARLYVIRIAPLKKHPR